MKNQCLSIEQMRHLQELGVDTSKASMFYVPKLEPKGEYCLLNVKPNPVIRYIHAFTLYDIIELLPLSINPPKCVPVTFHLNIYWYDEMWVVDYLGNEGDGSYHCISSDSIVDAAYQMFCWCAENGHLKGGEK